MLTSERDFSECKIETWFFHLRVELLVYQNALCTGVMWRSDRGFGGLRVCLTRCTAGQQERFRNATLPNVKKRYAASLGPALIQVLQTLILKFESKCNLLMTACVSKTCESNYTFNPPQRIVMFWNRKMTWGTLLCNHSANATNV